MLRQFKNFHFRDLKVVSQNLYFNTFMYNLLLKSDIIFYALIALLNLYKYNTQLLCMFFGCNSEYWAPYEPPVVALMWLFEMEISNLTLKLLPIQSLPNMYILGLVLSACVMHFHSVSNDMFKETPPRDKVL